VTNVESSREPEEISTRPWQRVDTCSRRWRCASHRHQQLTEAEQDTGRAAFEERYLKLRRTGETHFQVIDLTNAGREETADRLADAVPWRGESAIASQALDRLAAISSRIRRHDRSRGRPRPGIRRRCIRGTQPSWFNSSSPRWQHGTGDGRRDGRDRDHRHLRQRGPRGCHATSTRPLPIRHLPRPRSRAGAYRRKSRSPPHEAPSSHLPPRPHQPRQPRAPLSTTPAQDTSPTSVRPGNAEPDHTMRNGRKTNP
jgi:hypothetical protein